MVLEVVARELEGFAAANAGSGRGPVGMAAELLRTLCTGGGAAGAAPDRSVDTERLKAVLVGRGLITKAATLAPQRTALGFSKDTYLITVQEPGRPSSTVVVRRDLPGGPSRTTVVDEFPLLQ